MPEKSRARLLAERAEQVRIKSEELLMNRSEIDYGDSRDNKASGEPSQNSDIR